MTTWALAVNLPNISWDIINVPETWGCEMRAWDYNIRTDDLQMTPYRFLNRLKITFLRPAAEFCTNLGI